MPEGQQATAPVRSYMLLPGEGVYGAELAYGWMLNFNMLEAINGALDFLRVNAFTWVINKMAMSESTREHIYLDSNWLVSDGFECTDDNITRCVRLDEHTDVTQTTMGAQDTVWIIGRLNFKFSKHQRAKRIVGFLSFEPWPAELFLAQWVPQPLQALAASSSDNTIFSADKDPPQVFQSLMGGQEFQEGEVLLTEASPFVVRCYSYREPGSEQLQYARLRGDALHGDRLAGFKMFDEHALKAHATNEGTVSVLATPPCKRSILGYKFLLPGLDGHFSVEVDRSCLVQAIVTIAPQCSMGAKWALGVDGYFAFDHVVGEGCQLMPCPSLSRGAANSIEHRLFVNACSRYVCQHGSNR